MIRLIRLSPGILAIMILLTGCLSSGDEALDDSTAEATGLLSGVPSISELAGTAVPEIPPLPILDPDKITWGQELYVTHCAECHGKNLEGEQDWQAQNEDKSFRAPPHDAGGHTWHHGDKILFESIELGGERLPDSIGGTSNMPAFGDSLSDQEIATVLTFIKSTWPDDIRAIQWEQTIREQ